MRQHVEPRRQLDPVQIAQPADDEQHGVQAQAARPADRRGERDQLQRVEMREVRSSSCACASPRGSTRRSACRGTRPRLPCLPATHARSRCAAPFRRSRLASMGRCATARISALHSRCACGPARSSVPEDLVDRGRRAARSARCRARGRCGTPPRLRTARRSGNSGAPGARRWLRSRTARSWRESGRACSRVNANVASAAAIAMSQQATRPTPPPYAAPWMRATVGFGSSFNVAQHRARAPAASARFSARL